MALTPLEQDLDFSETLFELKKGNKLARKGWRNCKEVFIYLQPESEIPVEAIRIEPLKEFCKRKGKTTVKINGHIDLVTNIGTVLIGWTPSQIDMYAKDWMVVDFE